MEQLTQKQARVLEILRESGQPMFATAIAEEDTELFQSGSRSVTPLAQGLVKKGLVSKEAATNTVIDSKSGKPVDRTHQLYSLTDEGMTVEYEIK